MVASVFVMVLALRCNTHDSTVRVAITTLAVITSTILVILSFRSHVILPITIFFLLSCLGVYLAFSYGKRASS